MHSMLSISIYLGAFLSVSNSFGTVYLFSSLFGHFSCLQLFWDILSLFTAMSATLSTSISTSMLATLSTYMFNNPITTAITNHHCHISNVYHNVGHLINLHVHHHVGHLIGHLVNLHVRHPNHQSHHQVCF